jgi:protein-disulfide isomerase
MISRNRTFIITLTIIAASLIGLALSTLLIFEYYGAAPAAAEAVCAHGQAGVNSCAIVSASRYAAFRGIPLIGDVPIAVIGFIFYGFIAASFLLPGIRRKNENISPLFIMIFVLAGIALIGDIALYLISVFIIRFVCPLCVVTYAATAVILLSSILMLRKDDNSAGPSSMMKMKDYLNKQIVLFALIALVLANAGMGISAGANVMGQAKEASSYQGRLNMAIRQYETVKETAISLTEAPVIGKSNVQAQFIIFFDFTCVHCRTEFLLLEKLIKKYPDAVSVSFKFFPLEGNCGNPGKEPDEDEAKACIAMAAARCGHHQGKFVEYAKTLFDYYHIKEIKFSKKIVREAAISNRLNMLEFDRCLVSGDEWRLVNMDSLEGEKLGIKSTPTIFLNWKLLTAESRKADMLEGLANYCIEKKKQMR